MDNALSVGCLGPINNETRQSLGQLLWMWKLCGKCTGMDSCAQQICPWSRSPRYDTFCDLYEQMADAYSLELLGRKSAIENHNGLLDVIKKTKNGLSVSRRDLLRDIFESGLPDGAKPPTSYDQNRAFNIGASIVLLMDFGILHDAANVSEGTLPPILWREDVSANDFVNEAFPRRPVDAEMQRMLVNLKAKKLMKNAKLRLQATNDIRRHLVLDKKDRVIWMFHQSTALRELLPASENDPAACILPRPLMLEVLDTIHSVVFPAEPASQKILKSLVLKNGWDKTLLFDISTPYREDSDPEITYTYFGERLRELHKELQTPTPHGWLERRLKRKNETYMLKATMYGVFIAVTLGFLGLGVAIFQAWVAYQQWKHPVKES